MAISPKLFLILVLSGFPLFSCFSQITLNSQADVDAFDSSITTLSGDLTIQTTSTTDPILDLSNLSNVTSIGGDLYIYENAVLTNIDGLSGVTHIGGDLAILGNAALTNIDGLANITPIGGAFVIFNNAALTNIDGLANLTSIGGEFVISYNAALTNIDGLANLTFIGGNLQIFNNAALTNIDGLANVTSNGGYLVIHNNDALTNIDGLTNLTSIGGNLEIYSNAALTKCCAIQELLSTPGAIGGSINIYNNPSECSSEEEIIARPCMGIQISIDVPCIGAENGAIHVQVIGSTAPFTYIWQRIEDGQTGNGSSNEPNFVIENLGAGTYNLTVTDAEGQAFIREGIALIPIPGSVFEIIEITTTNSSNGMSNGAIHLTVAGGTAPYELSWSGVSSGMQTDMPDPVLTIPLLAQGEYEITVSDNVGNQQTVAITLLDETVPVFPCTQPLDIVILNDVSGSVDAVEYDESKQFFVDFLNEVNIGTEPDESRAAIVEWSGTSQQSVQIPITGDMAALQDYVNYSKAFDGGTDPHAALSFGEDYLASVARPDVARVLVLSTDGSGGQISPSLAALADQYKADGYHIVTIAFDEAFAESYTRDILRQVASIDALAPGAPAYSLLDEDLAVNIVNLYLCPIDPGSSATAYFNRDGAIDIIGLEAIGGCPTPTSVELTFTIEALRELSIPPGTPVTFYYNDPTLFGATPILTWQVPCAIPAGTSETYTVTLPVTEAASIFAILNNDDSQSPPISFPITNIDELAYSNNSSDTTLCLDPLPTLHAFKHAITPIPICNNMVIYTVDVCNITGQDASGVVITDDAPDGFVLLESVVNDNGCSTDNGGSYDIPAGCCVSITYTYDATDAAHGNYNDQDVHLSGDINQVYLDFDGANTAFEDVLIDGTVDCPSTVINFTKAVNVTDICEDAYVVYTFTIDNQLNIPLQGLFLTDVLPDPVTWAFQPYNLQGLSISHSTLEAGSPTFIIDEVAANTVASFSMDAALGDWSADGVLNNTASLDNVPDLEGGGIQSLTSNTVTTQVSAKPEITVSQAFDCSESTVTLSAIMNGESATDWSWVTTGDGTFSDNSTTDPVYTLGDEDLSNGRIYFSVTGNTHCGEVTETIEVVLEMPEPVLLDLATCTGQTIEYNGTVLSVGDTEDFTFENSNGCDSIVSVTVIGLPPSSEDLTLATCNGQTIEYNGTVLSAGDTEDFTFENSNGCDSIVSVTVIDLPPSSEDLTLATCNGQTIEYNGTVLSVGDTEGFTFENSNGCDSIVSVTVIGLPDSGEELILEICESETIEYQGTTLSVGATQDFTFENSNGCDSIVSVTVVELPDSGEELILEICESETIEYQGTTLSAGDTQDFTFETSNGCDSIVSVTVIGLPDSNEELTIETCIGEPVHYNGINLSIGDQRTFVFENIYGCDSITTVTVIGRAGIEEKYGAPNIFSPNDDGINDCFAPYFAQTSDFKDYNFQIFNRWGGLVFSATHSEACWDGRFRNKPAERGVYVWYVEMSMDGCIGTSIFSGDVVLVR